MNDVIRRSYRQRFDRVLEHIDAHLSENLDLESLSRVAHFSRFHFHRQFSAYIGISVKRYMQLLRLRRAGYRLAFRAHHSITDIALEAGYERPETFTRAFRSVFGQSPSGFREAPAWDLWHQALQPISHRRKPMKVIGENEVRIVQFLETAIALLEHRGPPESVPQSVRRFIEWRKRFGPSPRDSDTWNIVYDDPETTPADEYRFGIAATMNGRIDANDFGVVSSRIPAGRCAVLRHSGADGNIDESVRCLYGEWLPASGYELRDFPIFFHRVTLFPEVPEHEMLTDVYLPLL